MQTNYEKIKNMSIEEMAGTVKIKVVNKYGEHIVLLDLEDFEKHKNKKISVYYAPRHKKFRARFGNHDYIHRVVTNCPQNMVVDHINGNTLDNRKCNLRICTQKQNMSNLKIYSNNKSGIAGINIKNGKYRVQIGTKREHIGYYNTFNEAILAKQNAEIERGFYKISNQQEVQDE